MSLKTYQSRVIRQRPGRTFLTVASIVIGVAATVAISLVANTSRDAYKLMFATVTGKAQLEVVSGDAKGLASEILLKIQSIPGVKAAVPVISQDSVLYLPQQELPQRELPQKEADGRPKENADKGSVEDTSAYDDPDSDVDNDSENDASQSITRARRVRLKILGIDPELDHLVRDYVSKSGRMIREGNEAMVDAGFAASMGIKVGDEIKLLTPSSMTPKKLPVVGLWEPRGGSTITQSGLIYIPLDLAQKFYPKLKGGRVDQIQIVVDSDTKIPEVSQAIAAVLPEGVQVRPPNSETQLMKETLNATEAGLHLATLFCVLLACFIILNTFFMNISERRRQLAILRAIGASRMQIMGAIVGESLRMGLIGTLLGIGCGIGAAAGANRIITAAFEVPIPPMELTWIPFVLAPLIGFGMALVGAVVPAWHAGSIPPLEGMDRVSKADIAGSSKGILLAGASLVALAAIGFAGIIGGYLPLDIDRYFGVALLIGIVFLYELVVVPSAPLIAWVLRAAVGVEAQLALRQVLRHRVRTNLTTGVVFVAASTGIGLGYAILDNVENVRQWYRQAIRGDYFIRAMIPSFDTGESADLPEGLDKELNKIAGIRSLESISFVERQIGDKQVIVIAREFADKNEIPFDAIEGDPLHLVEELEKGKVVIGSVLALRMKLKAGDSVEMNTVHGPRKLEIAGVTNDYLVGGLSLYMHRNMAIDLLGLTGCDGYVVFAEPGKQDAIRDQLQEVCQKSGVLLHTLTDIRQIVEDKVVGLNVLLWALVILMFIVAAFGVVNTLTMNVLEQTRELAILRIVAMTRSQTRRTVICQAVVIGVAGVCPGVGAGIFIAWLINALTGPSIGHPVAFGSHPFLVSLTLLGGLFVTIVAAWLPARRAVNVDVVQALHYE